MYITLPEMKCIECGSRNNEFFIQRSKRGTRCIDCGHEKLERDDHTSVSGNYTLKQDNKILTF